MNTNYVTEDDTEVVHRQLLACLRNVRIKGDDDYVYPGVRWIAAQPRLKNSDPPNVQNNGSPRYPCISVFAFQPQPTGALRVGKYKEVTADPEEAGHFLVTRYDYPTFFEFRYQVQLAAKRQDYLDRMYMKVIRLFKNGAVYSIVVKDVLYEMYIDTMITRSRPEEGVQTTELDLRIVIPVLFWADPDDPELTLPLIEQIDLDVGIPTKHQELDEVQEFEEFIVAGG